MTAFMDDIQDVINRHSAENISNTPDFILAQYLDQCLNAFDVAVQQRETWYGRDGRPTERPSTDPPPAPPAHRSDSGTGR